MIWIHGILIPENHRFRLFFDNGPIILLSNFLILLVIPRGFEVALLVLEYGSIVFAKFCSSVKKPFDFLVVFIFVIS